MNNEGFDWFALPTKFDRTPPTHIENCNCSSCNPKPFIVEDPVVYNTPVPDKFGSINVHIDNVNIMVDPEMMKRIINTIQR